MTSIPTYSFYNNTTKYKYLEKVDKSPEYPDINTQVAADGFLLRRNRSIRKASNKDKLQAAIGSIIGTIIPMVCMMKRQNIKNPFKLQYGLKEMMILSGTPIIGGVMVGMIGNDIESNWGKSREGVFQFFNAAVPTWLAGSTLALCETTKGMNNIPMKMLSIIGAVFTGMLGAAAISNKICDPEDKRPDRKLTLKDSLANIDDLLGVLVLAKFPLADKLHVEKLLPIIYSYCGYRAGKSN